MKRGSLAWASLLIFSLCVPAAATPPARPADGDFGAVVSGIERQHSLRRTPIPLLWLARFCARVVTRGGVKRLQLAVFDDVGPALTPESLDGELRRRLGDTWHEFVSDRESGENTIVYARTGKAAYTLLIADLDNQCLSIVQLRLSPKRLAAWIGDPVGSLRDNIRRR